MTRNYFAVFTLSVVAVLLADGPMAAAQENRKEKDAVLTSLEERVSQFLESVSLDQAQSAFQDLLSGSQLLKQTDAVKDLVARTGGLEAKFGKYRAFEQVSAKRIGGDLVLMRYLYKCENFPVVWHFTFYHAPSSGESSTKNDAWRVVAIRFDANLDALQQ